MGCEAIRGRVEERQKWVKISAIVSLRVIKRAGVVVDVAWMRPER